MAAPPASGKAAGVNRPPQPMWTRADVVRLWEELIDTDPDVAEELFFAALLRDARAEQARGRAWKGPAEHGQVVVVDAEEEEQRRRARVFQPWEPSALPPPAPVVTVNRTVVLGLRAPPHLLASKHGMGMRTPSSAPTTAAGPRLPSEHVKKPPAV